MLDANQQATLVAQTKTLIDEWETLTPHQKITYLKLIFYKICVSRDGVDLHVSPNGMLACLTNEPQTKELPDKKDIVEVITVPIKLKRCGIEARLIVNNDMGQGPHAISVKAIQNALLKALQWHQGLVSGTITSTAEIAKTEGTAQRYVARILKFAFLAPDIMEAIIRGNIPVNCTIARLRKGFPMDWTLQRQTLGFTTK